MKCTPQQLGTSLHTVGWLGLSFDVGLLPSIQVAAYATLCLPSGVAFANVVCWAADSGTFHTSPGASRWAVLWFARTVSQLLSRDMVATGKHGRKKSGEELAAEVLSHFGATVRGFYTSLAKAIHTPLR